MCGRFTLHTVREALERRFAVSLDGLQVRPRYNVAPTQQVLTVIDGGSQGPIARWMRWGLIPPWEPQPRTRLSTINARLETVATSRLYRSSFERRRCLVLADGYYEWQVAEERRAPKTPYWIHRRDRAAFAFAGIYSSWHPRESRQSSEATASDESLESPLLSCSILTTRAFSSLGDIHARMPIILQRAHEAAWIAAEARTASDLAPLLTPDEEAHLTHHPVRTLVNSPRNDAPSLIEDAPRAGF